MWCEGITFVWVGFAKVYFNFLCKFLYIFFRSLNTPNFSGLRDKEAMESIKRGLTQMKEGKGVEHEAFVKKDSGR